MVLVKLINFLLAECPTASGEVCVFWITPGGPEDEFVDESKDGNNDDTNHVLEEIVHRKTVSTL